MSILHDIISKSAIASLNIDGQKAAIGLSHKDMTRDGGIEHVETLGQLEIRIEGRFFPEFDAMEWVLWLKNTGNAPTPMISDIFSADISMRIDTETAYWHAGINGDKCNAENFMPFLNPIKDGKTITVHPVGGRSSNGEFPCFDIQSDKENLIVAIGWSGQWQYSLSRTGNDLRMTIGLEKARFSLLPGEEVRLPRVLIKAFAGDPVDGHNDYRKLLYKYFAPRNAEGELFTLPEAIQVFDRYVSKNADWSTEAGQKRTADAAERLQYIDTQWFDAAWFRGLFPNGVGNYTFRSGFPNGLRSVSDNARAKGMKFMLWFEPERVTMGSETEQAHPEWVMYLPETVRPDMAVVAQDEDCWKDTPSGLFALGNKEAQEYLSKLLIDFIKREGIDIYRQDFNMDPLPYWRHFDKEGREGIEEIKYIMGFYKLWDDIRAAFPGIMIDNCSSGGRRIDLETCMRSVPLWRSDTGCSPVTDKTPSDMWNQCMSMTLTPYLAYHSTSSWNPTAYEFRSASTNGIAAQFAILDDGFDFAKASEALKEHRMLRKYWLGDFYPMTPVTQRQDFWAAWQLHLPDEDCGMAMFFRRADSAIIGMKACFKAVSENKNYRLIISDEQRNITEKTCTGKELLNGIEVTIAETRSSCTIEYMAE